MCIVLPSASGDQKWVADALKLKVGMIVNHNAPAGAGTKAKSSVRAASALKD